MLDVQNEQQNAHLRIAAAVIAMLAGVWLAWVEHRWWLRLTALASVLFAVRWIIGYRKLRGVVFAAAEHYLEVTPERITIAQGSEQRTIGRDGVRAIELDDDRLVVVLRLHTGEEVVIEPVYGGLGSRDLGETLQRVLAPSAQTVADSASTREFARGDAQN
jgi:hypothetical protein